MSSPILVINEKVIDSVILNGLTDTLEVSGINIDSVTGFAVQLIYTGGATGTFEIFGSNDDSNYSLVDDAYTLDGGAMFNHESASYCFVKVKLTLDGGGAAQVTKVTAPAPEDVPASSYFTLNSAGDATEYYVWFDTTGTDPSPAITGKTGIKVDISAAITAADVATAIDTAVSLITADFTATTLIDVVTITNTLEAITTNSADVNSTCTVTTFTEGEDYGTFDVYVSGKAI